jgi:protein involved in polysaccharide export with SLBB domain
MFYTNPKMAGRRSYLFSGVRLSLLFCLPIICSSAADSNLSSILSSGALDYLGHVSAVSTNTVAIEEESPQTAMDTNATNLVTVDALDAEHKLGIGDKVSFRILEDKIFDDKDEIKPLFVTDFGELEIPYLGRIQAVGKTCQQLAGEIKAVLEKKYYYQATVLIGVDILNKTHGRVYLAGKVKLPGYQDIPTDETFTVSKAIMRAGGFSEFADKRHVKVTRKKGGAGTEDIVTIDVAEVLEKGLAGKDLELGPDDRVFVPSKLINF